MRKSARILKQILGPLLRSQMKIAVTETESSFLPPLKAQYLKGFQCQSSVSDIPYSLYFTLMGQELTHLIFPL